MSHPNLEPRMSSGPRPWAQDERCMVEHNGFSVGPFSKRANAEHYLNVNARVPGTIVTLTAWRERHA